MSLKIVFRKGIACLLSAALVAISAHTQQLYVGTYTGTGSHGIYVLQFDPASGNLKLLDSAAAVNPSYVSLTPDGRRLYAVLETGGDQPGSVQAFTRDAATGKLNPLGSRPTNGDHPCFVDIESTGRWLAVANYSGGSMMLQSLEPATGFGGNTVTMQYKGSGPNAERQQKPHAHQSIFSHKGRLLWSVVFGSDDVMVYRMRPGKREPARLQTSLKMPAGSGPRHLAVDERNNRVYILGELDGKVQVWQRNGRKWQWIQSVASDTISAKPGSADIHLSPDGQYLYASNRADANNLAIYRVDQSSGRLTTVGYQSVLGVSPRNFTIHPSGQWLLVANQRSDEIVVFRRDATSGLLTPMAQRLRIPAPVCLRFVP